MPRKWLKVVEEVEKNVAEQQTDVTKHLTLAPSTLIFMVSKKRENEEKIDEYSKWCRQRKPLGDHNFSKIDSALLVRHHTVLVSGIPADGNILHEKAKKRADRMQVETFLCQLDGFVALKIMA